MKWLVLLASIVPAWAIFCSDVLQVSDGKPFALDQIRSMSDSEVDKCLTHLGKVQMPLDVAAAIWKAIKRHHGTVADVPEDRLASLHWVTAAIEPAEYENMTFASVDTVENFGLYYDLSPRQLAAVADRVRSSWGDKDFEDYSSYDLTALRQIVCAFNATEVERIHPAAYRDAAEAFAELQKCPPEVLRALADLAVDDKAFGPPEDWDESVKKKVGVVKDGLAVAKNE